MIYFNNQLLYDGIMGIDLRFGPGFRVKMGKSPNAFPIFSRMTRFPDGGNSLFCFNFFPKISSWLMPFPTYQGMNSAVWQPDIQHIYHIYKSMLNF